MSGDPSPHPPTLPLALLGLTAVTGLVDAVSFLALGHVFTANMTGNVIFLAFAAAGVPGVSVTRSMVALVAFMAGAVAGGLLVARPSAATQLTGARRVFALEVILLSGAAVAALGFDATTSPATAQLYAIIGLTAIAMGMRTAAVRKLGVLDLTTTVLTLTIAGLAADSSLARGSNPRWQRRVGSIVALFGGAAIGALLVAHSVSLALLVCVGVSSLSAAASMGTRRANPTS